LIICHLFDNARRNIVNSRYWRQGYEKIHLLSEEITVLTKSSKHLSCALAMSNVSCCLSTTLS
jgi:hypothetical protein